VRCQGLSPRLRVFGRIQKGCRLHLVEGRGEGGGGDRARTKDG
jgi:hypothetical protein